MEETFDKIADDYSKKYQRFGYSPKSLGWNKGKQFLRFHSLTHRFDLGNSSILDFGCGFGDFNAYLRKIDMNDYEYLGIDITKDFIEEANKRYADSHITFISGDFLALEMSRQYDYVISSGVCNHGLIAEFQGGGYNFIEQSMRKSFVSCNKAIAFDFLSDKVDYRLEHTFHSSPGKILEIAYGLSRNIIFDNSYFPFEFSVIIYKDDSFRKESTTYVSKERELDWLT